MTKSDITVHNSGIRRFFQVSVSVTPMTRYTEITKLVEEIAKYAYRIAIPIAVIMIIYAGIRFLFARGNEADVTKAKTILKWAIIGLAILTIGSGFIVLIEDILGL